MFKTKTLLLNVLLTSLICLPLLAHANILVNKGKQQVKSQAALLVDKAPIMALTSTQQGIVAVGSHGHLLTNNNNKNWVQHIVPTQTLLTGVAFASENDGWAVGHDATIIHTSDGGESWTLQQFLPGLDRPLLDVLFVNEQQGFSVGAYGMYFYTNDGGKTWNKQFLETLLLEEDIEYLAEVRSDSEEDYQFEISSILPHFNKIIQLQNNRLMLLGELGLIAFSNDNGKTWLREHNIYEGSFFTARQMQSKTILVGGLRGNVFRSLDDGKTWVNIQLGNNNNVNDIYQLKNGDIYLSQNNGVILKSIDDGLSFFQVSLQKGQDLMAVRELDNQIWVAGSKGLNLLKVNK